MIGEGQEREETPILLGLQEADLGGGQAVQAKEWEHLQDSPGTHL